LARFITAENFSRDDAAFGHRFEMGAGRRPVEAGRGGDAGAGHRLGTHLHNQRDFRFAEQDAQNLVEKGRGRRAGRMWVHDFAKGCVVVYFVLRRPMAMAVESSATATVTSCLHDARWAPSSYGKFEGSGHFVVQGPCIVL
jgi:hypothetical protein